MKAQEFRKLVRSSLEPVLAPEGFCAKRTKHSIYWRRTATGIYHVVTPDLSRWGESYRINVWATHLDLDLASEWNPDRGGIATDRAYELSDRGIARSSISFRCDTQEAFRADFEQRVKPLLLRYGLPHLRRFKTLRDLIPWIEHPIILAFAYDAIGKRRTAERLIRKNAHFLRSSSPDADGRFKAFVQRAVAIAPGVLND